MSCRFSPTRGRMRPGSRHPLFKAAGSSMRCDKSSTISPPATGREKSRRGFTLVELMVVIVIIGLLAGVVTMSVRSYLIRSRQNVAKLEIAKICQALDTFYSHFDKYPANEKGIGALTEKSTAFPEGLLNKMPLDPWGHPYEYQSPGRKGAYEVISYGADHREGGTGADTDISSDDENRPAAPTS